MFLDYKTKNGEWFTLYPLPLLKREELSKRLNKFNKFIPISQQILDSDELEYNLKRIISLYNLDINAFNIEEIDNFINEFLIKVNYSPKELTKQKLSDFIKKSPGAINPNPDDSMEIISKLFTSLWGICDNAGDAIYMLDKLPADMLLDTVKQRSADLKEMYMTDDEKRKNKQKEMIKEMKEKVLNEYKSN